MPSGRTHDRITLWTLPLVAGLTWVIDRSSTTTLLVCGGFLFGGLMFGPDLDIHSIHYKRWGWFRWIWIPYRGSVKHRSPLSHSPITGTLVRVLYLSAWLGVASLLGIAIVNQALQMGWTWEQIGQRMGRSLLDYPREWIALLIGLELGALSHYTTDWGVSTFKRVKTKGWQAVLPPAKKKRRRGGRSKRN